jgi:ATP-dependent DNA helicase DinG
MISLHSDPTSNPASPSGSLRQTVEHFFSPHGELSHAAGFEYRAEQQAMAVAVARALEEERALVVEAGTGVGKSLAYLIPAALHAVTQKRKALICTHTINLQEQLIYKDIPLVQKVLPVTFEAALLKGRQNYLCATRLERALRQKEGLFTTSEQIELERLREWSFTTRDGTLSDFGEAPDPQVWAQVCSERHLCTPKTCGKNPRCFYQEMRRRALAADVLVLNHTLFFTLLGGLDENELHERGFLLPNDFAIFDEAHTLETVASRHLGLGLSQYGLRQTLQRLYNPRTKKGLFTMVKESGAVAATAETLPLCDRFFEDLGDKCQFQKGREFRVRESGLVDGRQITERLLTLGELTAQVAGRCDEEGPKGELLEMGRRLREARLSLTAFLEQSLENHVYWVEQTGKREILHSLNAVPINLAALLGRLLFREGTPAILTSATLSTGGPSLNYFRDRVGAEDVPALQIGSPFSYPDQMKLFLVRKMPDPREPAYEAELERWIAHFTAESRARAFVLFTSYRTMQNIAARMENHYDKLGWDLFVQGGAMPRHRMLEEFRQSPHAVLFGTESFWTGVDVVGEALSNVIITRLPFATPDHPIIEAKLEAIAESGGDPFQDYSLPEAILKLRQGVGRLIRSTSDRGIVVILDSRILSKSYGRAFLRALPECPVEIVQ